jgi:hypothetical protein
VHRSRIPIGILLLIFILTIWNPATLALHLASTVWYIGTRSGLFVAFLGARLIITSVGVAAGIALWLKRPGAWSLYLQRSRRVSDAYGLESQSRNGSVRL